jgi:hypothetical protein
MDDDRVLARLGRIDALAHSRRHGSGAERGSREQRELLAELRLLVREAEELARGRTTDDDAGTKEVVGRLRTALARDIIGE